MGFLLCAETAPVPHSLQAQPGEGPGVVVLDVRKMGTRVSCEGRGLGHMGGAWSLGQGLTVNAELSGKVGTHAEGWAGRSPWVNAAETRSEHSGLWGEPQRAPLGLVWTESGPLGRVMDSLGLQFVGLSVSGWVRLVC